MARPIKRMYAEAGVVKELQRRSRSATIGVRDRERADIILLRLEGLGVEAVAEGLKTTAKRVSLWSGGLMNAYNRMAISFRNMPQAVQ